MCYKLTHIYEGGTTGWHIDGGPDCRYPEIDVNYCSIREPYIELDHGAVYAKDVNGSSISSTLHISCLTEMDVLIRSPDGDGSVILDQNSNFKSQISVNGVPVSTGGKVTATPQGTPAVITSTLNGVPPEGEYQGSTVIIISPV